MRKKILFIICLLINFIFLNINFSIVNAENLSDNEENNYNFNYNFNEFNELDKKMEDINNDGIEEEVILLGKGNLTMLEEALLVIRDFKTKEILNISDGNSMQISIQDIIDIDKDGFSEILIETSGGGTIGNQTELYYCNKNTYNYNPVICNIPELDFTFINDFKLGIRENITNKYIKHNISEEYKKLLISSKIYNNEGVVIDSDESNVWYSIGISNVDDIDNDGIFEYIVPIDIKGLSNANIEAKLEVVYNYKNGTLEFNSLKKNGDSINKSNNIPSIKNEQVEYKKSKVIVEDKEIKNLENSNKKIKNKFEPSNIKKNSKYRLILSVLLISLSLFLFLKERKANQKRKRINELRKIVNIDLNSKEIINEVKKDSIIEKIIFGGAGVITMIDVYSNLESHQDVLDTLQQRFPNELENYNMSDWIEKFNELDQKDSIESYISAFKGQEAENMAVEFLKAEGYENVQLFSELNHPDNDIIANLNGEEVEFSVKCGGTDYIEQCISKSDATNYIINSESYEVLLENGDIEEYAEQGIVILDGGFSEEDLSEIADNTIKDFLGVEDSLKDNIPYVAILVFGAKTIFNINRYMQGKQTEHELGVNIAVDLVRIGAGGVTACIGAKIGTTLGTIITPGVGTIIGGGIGTIVGAIAGAGIFRSLKENLKWGEIIKCIDYFGDKYEEGFTFNMKKNIKERYFNYSKFVDMLSKENKIMKNYENELNPYKNERETISAVLADEYRKNLELSIKKMDISANELFGEINTLCIEVSKKRFNTENKKNRLLGEIILSSGFLLKGEAINKEEKIKLSEYDKQKKKAHNHPYRFENDIDEMLKGLLYRKLKNDKTSYMENERNLAWLYYGGSIFACIISLFIVTGII